MDYILESKNINDYLNNSPYINYHEDSIQKTAAFLFKDCEDEIAKIKAAFEFVRDDISHSWDIQSTRVTKTAAEVLKYKEGICYAKSMLLAALLRSAHIPAGICYQRLTLGDTPESGYCIHALNAVYISGINHWTRIDARGNTGEKNAQFFPDAPKVEQLAFPVRPEYDEADYPTIYAAPILSTVKTLENNSNCIEMIKFHLPVSL